MKPLSEALPWGLLAEARRPVEDGPSGKWTRPEKDAVPASKAPRLEVLLQPRPLILTGLPYKRNDSLREITRTARTGAASVLKVTFLATESRYSLPFGADRGLLAWITTRAFADGRVRFCAIRDYFRAFRLDAGGRSYALFRERYQRIANLALRIEEISADERRVKRLFLVPEASEPPSLSKGTASELERNLLSYHRYGFELDPGFWQYLKDTRIPTPLDLLRRFHDQPQAWDFAQLLLFRCYTARSPSVVPWEAALGAARRRERPPSPAEGQARRRSPYRPELPPPRQGSLPAGSLRARGVARRMPMK